MVRDFEAISTGLVVIGYSCVEMSSPHPVKTNLGKAHPPTQAYLSPLLVNRYTAPTRGCRGSSAPITHSKN